MSKPKLENKMVVKESFFSFFVVFPFEDLKRHLFSIMYDDICMPWFNSLV